MSDKYKLLEKIRSGPRNVKPNKLKKLMRLWGFIPKDTKDGALYYHPQLPVEIIRVVYHREGSQENKVLECYVKNCIKAIDKLVDIQEVRNEG